MKLGFILTPVMFFSLTALAQEPQNKLYPLPADVESISGILTAAYDVISGEAGAPRQWERDRSLHSANAIISKNVMIDGKPDREVITLDQFYAGFNDRLESGFFEEEINREVRIFGTIAHVWSTYQQRNIKNGPIIGRGINSIQLYFKNDRWWILSWNWDVESEGNKIPASFDSY